MATNTTAVAGRESLTAAPQQRGRATESAIRAPVDIFEDSESITLAADMPGVPKDRLDVRVDGNTLLLEGTVQFELPEQAEALYADVRSTVYRRSFVLSRELEAEKVQANPRDGVLTVRIPKRLELRPRKIEVQGP
ncbi:MAG: Hsp20/alpha crystallin family protein [Steroidobacteraceae bacterium]|jgi:HSP20 family protein